MCSLINFPGIGLKYFYCVQYLFILYLCFEVNCHIWRVTIQQRGNTTTPRTLHVAEVHFFHKNKLIDGSNFEFTSNMISIGGGYSGPPEAANDGNIYTFYHNGFEGAEEGNTGICCPDPNPALFITNTNKMSFERMRIISRQDLNEDDMHLFNQMVGTTVTVQDADSEVIFSKEIQYGESSYDFHIMPSTDIAAHKWMEKRYFMDIDYTAHHLWIDNTTFNYKEAHPYKYSFDDLQSCFRNKTVLMIGDSTGRETIFHMIHLVTSKYPSPDGSYPPSDYSIDFEG